MISEKGTDLPDVLPLSLDVIEQHWDEWVEYVAFDRKFLPRPGGLWDQPDTTKQVFLLLDGLLSKMTLAQSKEASTNPEEDN